MKKILNLLITSVFLIGSMPKIIAIEWHPKIEMDFYYNIDDKKIKLFLMTEKLKMKNEK